MIQENYPSSNVMEAFIRRIRGTNYRKYIKENNEAIKWNEEPLDLSLKEPLDLSLKGNFDKSKKTGDDNEDKDSQKHHENYTKCNDGTYLKHIYKSQSLLNCHVNVIQNCSFPKHNEIKKNENINQASEYSKSFGNKNSLNGHSTQTHNGGKLFVCPDYRQFELEINNRTHNGKEILNRYYCNKTFAQESSLKAHTQTDTGKNLFKCLHCSKTFPYKCKLVNHIRTHTGEKPFKCSECETYFRHRGNLVRHIKIHTGEKPFKCHYCSKSYYYKESIEYHIRTHTGETPFKCPDCKKCFKCRRNLKSHTMRIHPSKKAIHMF